MERTVRLRRGRRSAGNGGTDCQEVNCPAGAREAARSDEESGLPQPVCALPRNDSGYCEAKRRFWCALYGRHQAGDCVMHDTGSVDFGAGFIEFLLSLRGKADRGNPNLKTPRFYKNRSKLRVLGRRFAVTRLFNALRRPEASLPGGVIPR